MSARRQKAAVRVLAVVTAAMALTVAAPRPASAGFFERLFGGLRHAAPPELPAAISAFADPLTGLERAVSPPQANRGEAGPASAYCVRTCDGYHFRVHANAGASAADMCHAFCPGSHTALYSGSTIDTALAGDGSRYADLDEAYTYREKLIAGCTCNGRDAFGLAKVDVAGDPTLKPGDVVATKEGLMAFAGARDKAANFTPIADYNGFPKSYRDKLSELKVAPGGAQVGAPIAPVRATDSRNASK